MSKGLVLVSGATGFLGTAVTRAFVEAGYFVRATSRSKAKADQWAKFNPEHAHAIEWMIVPDGGAPNAYDEAVKGVDYVAHTASPFHQNTKDNEKDMLIPAVNGTKNILDAAKKESTIKHVVITSSMLAVIDILTVPGAGKTYTRDSWNPATRDDAVSSTDPVFVYAASKKLAERAAWEDTERKFPITAICPPLILGPPYQPLSSLSAADLNTSSFGLYTIMSGSPPLGITNICAFGVDVRDVAEFHVRALTSPPPTPENAQRFLTPGWEFFEYQFGEYLCSSSGLVETGIDWKKRVSADLSKDQPFEHFALDDGQKSLTLLGRPYIPREQSFRDSVLRLLELEKMFAT